MIPCPSSKGVGAKTTEAEVFLECLKADFPDLRFVQGRKFAFRPPRTIMVESFGDGSGVMTGEKLSRATEEAPSEAAKGRPDIGEWKLLLLHELGHATLGHRNFKTNVERLKMEVAAWEKAREFTSLYGVEFDDELMESELDSYRDWVHQKSRCPKCGLTRYETPEGGYHCPRCENI